MRACGVFEGLTCNLDNCVQCLEDENKWYTAYLNLLKKPSACDSCNNPDECNIGCYPWMRNEEPDSERKDG